MTAVPGRLAAFVVMLLVVFAGAFLAGNAVGDPDGANGPVSPATTTTTEMHHGR